MGSEPGIELTVEPLDDLTGVRSGRRADDAASLVSGTDIADGRHIRHPRASFAPSTASARSEPRSM
jgi:hypothetical protein